jgi:hypothetical protein
MLFSYIFELVLPTLEVLSCFAFYFQRPFSPWPNWNTRLTHSTYLRPSAATDKKHRVRVSIIYYFSIIAAFVFMSWVSLRQPALARPGFFTWWMGTTAATCPSRSELHSHGLLSSPGLSIFVEKIAQCKLWLRGVNRITSVWMVFGWEFVTRNQSEKPMCLFFAMRASLLLCTLWVDEMKVNSDEIASENCSSKLQKHNNSAAYVFRSVNLIAVLFASFAETSLYRITLALLFGSIT